MFKAKVRKTLISKHDIAKCPASLPRRAWVSRVGVVMVVVFTEVTSFDDSGTRHMGRLSMYSLRHERQNLS